MKSVLGSGRTRQAARRVTGWAQRLPVLRQPRHPVTILMYHSISDRPAPYTVTPRAFRSHVEFIARRYAVTRLTDVPALLAREPDGVRRVVITFDDAYRDFEEHALPVLRDFSLPCTVFVPTGHIGQADSWNSMEPGWTANPLMSADRLRDVASTGLVEFGSHTVRHVRMTRISPQQARDEAVQSKRDLEHLLGRDVTTFAYPHGQLDDFSPATTDVLREAGYAVAVTTHWGTYQSASDILRLRRVVFETEDTPDELAAIAEGSDDWIALKERMAYWARRVIRKLPPDTQPNERERERRSTRIE